MSQVFFRWRGAPPPDRPLETANLTAPPRVLAEGVLPRVRQGPSARVCYGGGGGGAGGEGDLAEAYMRFKGPVPAGRWSE